MFKPQVGWWRWCAGLMTVLMLTLAMPAMAQVIETVHNPGFEELRPGGGKMMPLKWWLNPREGGVQPKDPSAYGVSGDVALAGKYSLYVDSATQGTIGWISEVFPIPANSMPGYRLTVRLKRSSDYDQNQPFIMIAWFKGDRWIGQGMAKFVSYGDWETWSVQETGDMIPEQADGAKVFVGTTASGFKGTPKGRIWFDQVSLESVAPANGLVNFRMKSDRDLAWYTLKQPVIFKTSQANLVSPKIKGVTATIYDSRNQEVDRITVARQAFLKDGIVWQPKATGHYEFEFACQVDGQKEPVKLTYVISLRTREGDWWTHQDTRHRVGVVADEPRPLTERVQFMGRQANGNDTDDDYRIFDTLELCFNRYHNFLWYRIEPEKGKFNWEMADRDVAKMRQHGLIVGNIWGTAQWASPHPDRTEIDIFIPKYCAFAPVNMDDFRHYLRTLVNRYKDDIKIWEIWNEPHLPYGSIFWRDTPEKFVELLKAGYETIKEVQPESEIWIGGMGGRRYLPFYKEFLRLGGGVYYDRLALHGSWPTTPSYRALEKKYGAPSKPWVDSEWHAILFNASDETIPTETELGRRMLTDLCVQIKDNVEKIVVFGMHEWLEREFIIHFKKKGQFGQSAGLFREKPYRQPRLAAVLLRTFLDQFAGQRIDFVSESLLGDQGVVQLTSDRGPVMVIWSNAKTAQPLNPSLASILKDGARFIDWEGKSAQPELLPGMMYYLIPAKGQTIAKLPQGSALPVEPASRRDVPVAIEDVFYPGRLFASAESAADPKAIRWIDKGWKYEAQDDQPQPKTFNARMAVAMNVDGLDLLVEVDDAVQHQKAKQGGQLYAGDSLQFAIATDDTGHMGSQVEFQVGFIGDLPIIQKDLAPWAAGDLPANWSQTGQPIKYGWVKIDRQPSKTVYRLHIDKSELYPWAYSPDDPQFFSLLVNNNDGRGRAGYLTWSAGIGEKKDPTRYGRLKPTSVNDRK